MKQMLIKSAKNNFIDRSSTIKGRCESMHVVARMCDDMLILIAKKLVYNFFIAQVMHFNKMKFF